MYLNIVLEISLHIDCIKTLIIIIILYIDNIISNLEKKNNNTNYY